MRVKGYVALHYGSDYLAYALQAVYPVVEEILVAYTNRPSYGHGTTRTCPDSESALRAIVQANDPERKIRWYSGQWNGEGEHRDNAIAILDLHDPEDVVVVFDSDEVWDTETLREAISSVRGIDRRNFLVPFQHFFKSFGWACSDGQRPVRLIKPACSGDCSLDLPKPVYHFGYTLPYPAIEYKWSCHGHQAELRPGWLERYRDWKPGEVDMHPVMVNNFWHPEPFDRTRLPEILHSHPFFSMDVIA